MANVAVAIYRLRPIQLGEGRSKTELKILSTDARRTGFVLSSAVERVIEEQRANGLRPKPASMPLKTELN